MGDNQSKGSHAIAVGIDAQSVNIKGLLILCGGMNKQATIIVWIPLDPVLPRVMSGKIVVEGDASQYAGATGHSGLLVVEEIPLLDVEFQ